MIRHTGVILAAIAILALASASAGAQNVTVELGAGAHSIQTNAQVETMMDMTTLYAGGGFRYEEDLYTLFHIKGGLKQSVFAPALTVGMGFTGIAGNYEIKKEKYDLSVVGFTLMASCDLARTAAAVPLTLFSEATLVPSPMCFIDCTRYLELTGGVEINVIERGAIVVQYNYLKTEFEAANKTSVDDSKGVLRLGFRLKFG